MGQGNIIGYEINEKTCQISFYNEEMAEPETMEVDADNYQIPLVIGKLRDTWAYGKEAKRLASLKEGFTVNRLLDKSLAGEKIEFGEESYEAVWLLAKFIELSLQSFPKINGIVFSVPELTEELAQMLRGIAVRMNIDKRHIFIQDYKESFCNYLFYQPKELWQYEAALFCCDRNEIKAYMLRRLRPGLGGGKTTFVTVDEVAKEATYTLDMSNLINDPNFDGGTVSINGVGIEYEKGMSADDVYKQLMSVADEIGCKFEKDPNKAGVYNITADNKGSKETLTIGMSKEMAQKTGLSKAQGVVQNADDESYKLIASGSDAKVTLGNEFGSTVITNVEGNRVKITDKGGFSMDFLLSDDIQATGATLVFDVTDVGAMTIQIGANQYQNMDVHIPEVSSESLYLDTVNVAVNGGADKAISTMDAAIAKLSAVRSGIGAYTNRLEYASSSLAETQEDMTTAYSGLMDTDMASEMTEYTQQNILEQAAVSVLSQANDIPQQVLSLLQK